MVKKFFSFFLLSFLAYFLLWSFSYEKILKKYNFSSTSLSGLKERGWVEKIYVWDLDEDGKKDLLVIEKGRRRVCAFSKIGKKMWSFAFGRLLKVFKNSSQKMYLLYLESEGDNFYFLLTDGMSHLLKKIKLEGGKYFLNLKDKKNSLKVYLADINFDSSPELIFASNYGDKIIIYTLSGEIIPKRKSLLYLPDVFSNPQEYEKKFLLPQIYRSQGNILFYPYRKGKLFKYKVVLDRNFKKQWLKIYDEGELMKKFSFNKVNIPSVNLYPFFSTLSIGDYFPEEKGYEFIFGGKNRIFIFSEKLELLKIWENVFY